MEQLAPLRTTTKLNWNKAAPFWYQQPQTTNNDQLTTNWLTTPNHVESHAYQDWGRPLTRAPNRDHYTCVRQECERHKCERHQCECQQCERDNTQLLSSLHSANEAKVRRSSVRRSGRRMRLQCDRTTPKWFKPCEAAASAFRMEFGLKKKKKKKTLSLSLSVSFFLSLG